MKKLRLDLHDLRVDSFEPASADAEEGTVEGYATLRCTGNYATCRYAGDTCVEGNTCDANCPGLTWINSCPCYPETGEPETNYEIPSCQHTCADTCGGYPC